VAGVGFAVGYDSPSQFSREYSRQFGRPPGRDLERLRADPALGRLGMPQMAPPARRRDAAPEAIGRL